MEAREDFDGGGGVAAAEIRGGVLFLRWAAGGGREFHPLWLRDNCPCEKCRHPNGQKLTNITDLPADVRISSAESDGNGGVCVVFAPENHEAHFDGEWLRGFAAAAAPPPQTLWDDSQPSVADIAREYESVAGGGKMLAEWLELIVRYGCAVLRGAPAREGEVCRVAEWFGFVRETNYGRLFDVRAVASPNNLAYTGMGLSVHTDNPYRDPPPGLQLLHCLQNAASGGKSVLVDGFAAAEMLREENPEHFRQLSERALPFHFSDGNCDLRSRFPVIETAGESEIRAVRFNNRSLAAAEIPADEAGAYYSAYRRFAEMLFNEAPALRFKMCAGDLFIVNNNRVLHGRDAFSGGGGRHLQGCYADLDSLLSQWRVLRREQKQKEKQ